MAQQKVKYPDNLHLKKMVKDSGRSIKWYAGMMKVTRTTISLTINGHYKGNNIVPKLKALLNA